MSVGLQSGRCYLSLIRTNNVAAIRHFNSSPVVLARKEKKIPTPTKKQMAAKARRRAAKAPKSIYDAEKVSLSEAIAILRAVEVASPNSTLEMTIRTAMPKHTAIPKGRLNWPREAKAKGEDRILVFAEGRQAEEAKKAGADIVGGLELVDGIISGKHRATTILCSPALIRAITPKLGRFLGPLGLMPSERRGTVTEDFAAYIKRLQGSVEWKGDRSGTIRTAVAKVSWPTDDITKNVRYFLSMVKKATGNERDPDAEAKGSLKPTNALTRVILSSRQGPGIQIVDV